MRDLMRDLMRDSMLDWSNAVQSIPLKQASNAGHWLQLSLECRLSGKAGKAKIARFGASRDLVYFRGPSSA
jgi:hypothetical protein